MSDIPELIIQAVNLSKTVVTGDSTLTILKDINLGIQMGESVAIIGPSGSGKTTLLSLLAGLDLPSAGTVLLRGRDLNQLSEDQRAAMRSDHISIIFQTFQLLPGLTALENVMLPLELKGGQQAKSRAQHWLDAVGLSQRANHYPQQLSGGEQQRVAIARAFIAEPEVLFADEPTGNLDQTTGQHIIELLFELNKKQGVTLVVVTHDEKISQKCGRAVSIESGQIQ